MNKITLIILTVFLNVGLFSCSPETINSDNEAPQACCGDDSPIMPPPPDKD